MKRQFTCIICPNGCKITAEIGANGVITSVEGHTCKKGEEYVQQELTHPVRTIATSVLVKDGELPLVSVRVDGAIPKERIFDAMAEIKGISLTAPVVIGQHVISNLLGLEVNVIATKNIKRIS